MLKRYILFLVFFIVAISTLGVSAALLSMFFGRPIGDDYGAISTYHYSENWFHVAWESLTSTGRYGQSLLASILYGSLGNRITIILPILSLFIFIAVAYLYIRYAAAKLLTDLNGFELRMCSILAALVLTFLVLFINNTPQTTTLPTWASFQLFFWSSGIITYTLPLLALISGVYFLFLSRITKSLKKRSRYLLFGMLVYICSLFNEIQPVVMVSISIGLLALSYIGYYRGLVRSRVVLLIAFAASTFGLISLYFSPGRLTRSAFLDTVTTPAEGTILDSTVRNIMTLTRDYYFRPREIALLVLIGLLLTLCLRFYIKNLKKLNSQLAELLPYMLLLPILCVLSAIVSFLLIGLGYGYYAGVYSRTLLITQLIYVVTIPVLVFTFSTLFLDRFKSLALKSVIALTSVVSILVLISVPNYIGKLLVQINSSISYSNLWDAQDSYLKEKAADGIKETVYLSEPATGMGDGFSLTCTGQFAKTTMWLNVQIWEYYGKNEERVCAVPDKDITP